MKIREKHIHLMQLNHLHQYNLLQLYEIKYKFSFKHNIILAAPAQLNKLFICILLVHSKHGDWEVEWRLKLLPKHIKTIRYLKIVCVNLNT